MRAYAEDYLSDVVETQGKLFDFVAQEFPDKDTEEFIKTYMKSNTRKSIDEAQAYVNTMDCKELWEYFLKTEQYSLKNGEGMKGLARLDWRVLCVLPVVLQYTKCRSGSESTDRLFEKSVLWLT